MGAASPESIVVSVLQSAQTPGINVIGMTMLLQFVVSSGFILPMNAPQNMVASAPVRSRRATS